MSDLSFGLTVSLIGMGGTMFSLWILSLLVQLLKRGFPYKEETKVAEARES